MNRLRVVFASIAIVLLSAIIIGVSQVRSLEQSSQALTTSSVPVFIHAAELERDLKNLLVLLQSVDNVENVPQLQELADQTSIQLLKLRKDTGVTDKTAIKGSPAAPISASLTSLENSSALILAGKTLLLQQKKRIAATEDALRQVQDRTRKDLETLAFQVAETIEQGFSRPLDGAPQNTDLIEQHYHLNLIRATAITELSLEIEAIIDLAIRLNSIDEQSDVIQAERNLRFKINAVVVLLGRIPFSDTRVILAKNISHIRRLIFADEGLLQDVLQHLEIRKEFETQLRGQIAPIRAISTLTRELSDTAQTDVHSAGLSLERKADRLVLILLAAGVISAATIIFAMYFLVERQINRRMAKLTRSVLQIAVGQTKTQVDVCGDDELGKMARALEVFKTNAHELQRSNTELEKFAYVAAHDLRSPLRAIRDLSEWVVEDPDTEFSEDGREYMTLLQARIERLNLLLSDLLEYSRAGKEQDDVSTVSIAEIVRETAGLLDPENTYNISYHGVADAVMTYATPLRHILLNLVNNAIKHHDRPAGAIRVSAEISMGWIKCAVTDDGPGIAPHYHNKIFNLFQTLRPRDEVEGSGLGLAIIEKLLEHHGGTIHVQSDPKKARGATFTFLLPDKSPQITNLSRAA